MSRLQVSLAGYALELVAPFPIPNSYSHTVRAGHIIRLTDENGVRGYGETAPLAGVHPEKEDVVANALSEIAPELAGAGERPLQAIRRLMFAGRPQIPTVVHFGLEMAAVNLEAARRRRPPAELLSADPRPDVEIQTLVQADPHEVAATAQAGAFENRSRVKVKIGRADSARERAALEELDRLLPQGTLLRLDGNRKLDAAGIHARVDTLDPGRIEYLEEPLADPAGLEALAAETRLDIALDESLFTSEGQLIAHADYVGAWVVRPSLVGGVLETLALAKRAQESDRLMVLASSLESGLGLSFLVQLAAALPSRATAMGLGTDRWLREDLIAPPFDSSAGRMRIDQTLGLMGGPAAFSLDWWEFGDKPA